MSNSSLVTYTKLSPNHSGKRTHAIDRITPHCVVGQLSCESICGCFTSRERKASCNYGIGTDGRVCLCVDEENRSWCSSSNDNDQRAITIECASDSIYPYTFNEAVYQKLIELCVDICARNGKTKLIWFGDKTKTLNYTPLPDEMVLTVHRWFANKSCPGDWMYAHMPDLAEKVTALLKKNTSFSPASSTSDPKRYRVQAGAFRSKANAESNIQKLKSAGFDAILVQENDLYKIQVGTFTQKSGAEEVVRKLKAIGTAAYVTLTRQNRDEE